MARFNPHKLRKKDLVWLMEHRCRAHGMPYIEHPKCFDEERPESCPFVERIGFFDIEATNLQADFGYVLSWCIKEGGGDIIEACVTPGEIRKGKFDERIIRILCKELARFDRIVVYWGTDYKFDLPYVRTRALHYKLDFPEYMAAYATDLHTIVKAKLRLRNNRLQTACDFFEIPSKGHRLDPTIWQRAQAGDQESLNWILEHNREDVVSTEALYNMLIPHYRNTRRSM